jgi:hypothetical protein
MLEAMACGTPVIGFEVGGLPDMIKNGVTGYLAPCFDSQKMAELILGLIFNDTERRQLNLNCRQLIEEKYKLEDQAKQYLLLFDDLLKKSNRLGNFKEEKKIILDNNTIVLNEQKPVFQKELFGLYQDHGQRVFGELHSRYKMLQQKMEQKKSELENFNKKQSLESRMLQQVEEIKQLEIKIANKNADINQLKKKLSQKEDRVTELYKSYSYRIGHFILLPIKKIRLLYWKIRRFIKN